MNNAFNERILNRIFNSIKRFRCGQISSDEMISSIWGNLTVLEGLDYESLQEFLGYLGEIEFMKWTMEPEVLCKGVMQELNEFENNLKRYFNIYT